MTISTLKPDMKGSVPAGVPGRHHATVCKPLNFGCWNVRTVLDIEANVQRHERKSALVVNDMNVVARSETRFLEKGHFMEKSGGYTFFWSGRKKGKTESGVAFAIRTSITSQLEEFLTSVNDRMITMRVPLVGGRYAKLIGVYAPTMVCTDEVKEAFTMN